MGEPLWTLFLDLYAFSGPVDGAVRLLYSTSGESLPRGAALAASLTLAMFDYRGLLAWTPDCQWRRAAIFTTFTVTRCCHVSSDL
jgi:hypothetical protein